jgi:coenzyme F420-reducing hydrogenase gamma subunit
MRKLAAVVIAMGVCFAPAFAQTPSNEVLPAGEAKSRADCQAQFRYADKDGDGALSSAEAENASKVIPTDLALRGPITRTEFMDACMALIDKGG